MKNWKLLHNQPLEKLDLGKIASILLKNRGIATKKEIETFLNPSLKQVTSQNVGIDTKELKKTLGLIKRTVRDKKWIVVYGDYDVDGICATAILWEVIYSFYPNVHPYIPHRVDEGYGLSEKGISNCQSSISNIGLIITVDNGIVAGKAVNYAKSQGINTVITDHHVTGETLPEADAIVHTTQLCGTGIAYLLAQEISKLQPVKSVEENHLELVALATVADLVPLNMYNRALLKAGLDLLRKTKRPGLLALLEEAQIKKEEIDTYHIGHIIAPRLNASGRISHALDSLRLLCTKDKKRAQTLARQLGDINRERQRITSESCEDAKEKVKTAGGKLLFVESEMYEQGVIGLIASRLTEEFHKPSIAVSVGEKMSKGSARSIPGVNIMELIRTCSDILAEAGGHPMAAGFSIETVKLADLKTALVKKAEGIDEALFKKTLSIDMELPFHFIKQELFNKIEKLKPFGMDNPQPVFLSKGVTVSAVKKVGKDGAHAQLFLEKEGKAVKGILFRNNGDEITPGKKADIVFTLDQNEWNGNKRIELKIKDVVLSSTA